MSSARATGMSRHAPYAVSSIQRSPAQIAAFTTGILWLILPSLLLFIVLPAMLHAGFSFWVSLGAGCAATVLGYGLTLLALRAWGAH